MKPLAELHGAERLRGLLFDIDDTLTTAGRLTAEAYAALERLQQAGRIVIAVTGRPAGWCGHMRAMWSHQPAGRPVTAITMRPARCKRSSAA